MKISNETLSKIEPLINQKVWCSWRLETRDGRQTKVPYQPNGIHAKSNDPKTWSNFSEVLTNKSSDGIGFFFNGRILGIDIDKVLVDGKIIDPRVEDFLKKVNTYVEVSPSGKGLHILFTLSEDFKPVANKTTTNISNENGIVAYEIYTAVRYFTFTGNEYLGAENIRTIDKAEAEGLLSTLGYPWKKELPNRAKGLQPQNVRGDDSSENVTSNLYKVENSKIIKKILEDKKYGEIYSGSNSYHNGDKSSADMSLMRELQRLTGANRSQMREIFLHSPRGDRDKVSVRADYLPRLVEECIQKYPVKQFYDWSREQIHFVFKPKKLSEILQQEFEETDWLVEGLLVKSGSSILVSKPKVGKSLLARNLCMSVATGNRFLGKETKQGNVLYISLEESERNIRTHFVKMGATGEEAIYLVCAPGEYIPRAINALKDILEEFKPVLVVIDTLFRFIQVKDSNNYAEMTKAISPIIKLANEAGAHIMLIHHSRKADGDVGDSTLGSTAIFGSIETNMALQRTKDGLTLETSQRYGAPLPTTYITLNEESLTFALLETKKERQVRDISNEILDLLALQAAPITERELMEDIHGDGSHKRSILNELVKNGLVSKEGKGIKGNPYKYSILNLDIYTGNENRESIEDVSAEYVRSEMIVKRSNEPLSADDK